MINETVNQSKDDKKDENSIILLKKSTTHSINTSFSPVPIQFQESNQTKLTYPLNSRKQSIETWSPIQPKKHKESEKQETNEIAPPLDDFTPINVKTKSRNAHWIEIGEKRMKWILTERSEDVNLSVVLGNMASESEGVALITCTCTSN